MFGWIECDLMPRLGILQVVHIQMKEDRLQAVSIEIQAYSMKIDLLTNATVVERAVKFHVDKHRDETFIPQKNLS